MTTQVSLPEPFKKALRDLERKYRGTLDEVEALITHLEADERPGDKIPRVGYDTYKVRLANRAANRGKSGGMRVIYYVRLANQVILLTIYSKTEQTDIAPEAIRQMIEKAVQSLKDAGEIE